MKGLLKVKQSLSKSLLNPVKKNILKALKKKKKKKKEVLFSFKNAKFSQRIVSLLFFNFSIKSMNKCFIFNCGVFFLRPCIFHVFPVFCVDNTSSLLAVVSASSGIWKY